MYLVKTGTYLSVSHQTMAQTLFTNSLIYINNVILGVSVS